MDYNKYKHSVVPSLDYQFASEKYSFFHPWYSLSKTLKKEIENTYHTSLFNIKYEIQGSFINVYLYFDNETSLQKIPSSEFKSYSNDDKLLNIINTTLKKYSPKGLNNVALNVNGVSLNNYQHVWNSYHLNLAHKELDLQILNKFSIVKRVSTWDTMLLIFIENDISLNILVNQEAYKRELKQMCLDILKKYKLEHITITLHNYEIYKNIGGYHYFNSDYFINGISI